MAVSHPVHYAYAAARLYESTAVGTLSLKRLSAFRSMLDLSVATANRDFANLMQVFAHEEWLRSRPRHANGLRVSDIFTGIVGQWARSVFVPLLCNAAVPHDLLCRVYVLFAGSSDPGPPKESPTRDPAVWWRSRCFDKRGRIAVTGIDPHAGVGMVLCQGETVLDRLSYQRRRWTKVVADVTPWLSRIGLVGPFCMCFRTPPPVCYLRVGRAPITGVVAPLDVRCQVVAVYQVARALEGRVGAGATARLPHLPTELWQLIAGLVALTWGRSATRPERFLHMRNARELFE